MPTNLTSSIELLFRGTNLVGPAATSALRDVDRFTSGVQSAVAPIALLTTGVLALEAAGARYAVSFAKDAVASSLEFGRAQTELNKVLDEGAGDIATFTPRIIELSNKYGVLSPTILRAAADFVKAGFDIETSLDGTQIALDGAIAGEIELTDVSVQLRSALAGFGIDAADSARALEGMGRILDVTNEAANRFNVDFDQLLEGITRFSPIAKQANLSIEQTAAVVASQLEVFQEGSIIGRASSTLFQRLVNDNPKVVAALNELGISQEGANKQLKTGAELYFETIVALRDLDQTSKIKLATDIAGADQAAKLLAGTDRLNTALAIQADSFDATGSAAKEAAIVLAGTAKEFERNAAAADNFRIAFGQKLDEALKGITIGFGNILRALEELTRGGSLDAFFAQVIPQLNQITRIANEVAEALPKALENADFSGVGEGIEALFGDLSNIKIDDKNLAEFITNVSNGFADLAKFTSGVIDVFRSVAAIVGPVITGFGNLDESTQNVLTAIGGGALVIAVFGGAISGLIDVGGGLLKVFTLLETRFGGLGKAIALIAGPLGVGLLTFELGKLIDLNDRLQFDWLSGFEGATVGSAISDLFDRFSGLNDEIRNTPVALENAQSAVNALELQPLDLSVNIVPTLTEGVELQPLDLSGLIPTIEPLSNFTFEVDKAGKVIPETLQRIGAAAKKTGADTKEGVLQARQALIDYELKALEVASNERIAIITSKFEFDIAKLESDTRQIEAAFSSLDNTVSSTGDLLGGLFGLLPQLDRFDQLDVFNQIEKEDRRREKALELQTKLVKAQIEKIKAQTTQLRRGKALIQIDASPLSPHLQNILHEILAQIQLTASADLTEFLLNVNPGLNPSLPSTGTG